MDTASVAHWSQTIVDPFYSFMTTFMKVLPGAVGGLFLFATGWLVALFARKVISKTLGFARLNEQLARVGLAEIFYRLGLKGDVSSIVGFIAYWVILLFFLVAAVDAAGHETASRLIHRAVIFLPHVAVGIFVIIAGLMIGFFTGTIVRNACEANGIKEAGFLGRMTNAGVLLFAVLLALQKIGFSVNLLISTFDVLFGAICIAVAIAVGLGAREQAREILKRVLQR